MIDPLHPDDVSRRAAAVEIALDDLRIESVVRLSSPIHAALPGAIADTPFEREPASFDAVLAQGARR